MRNVVITGVGIKSCIGNTYQEVLDSLKNGRSGITANETYKEMGFRSQVSGNVDLNFAELIDRKLYRFMGEASAYAYLAAQDAIEMAGISEDHLNSEKFKSTLPDTWLLKPISLYVSLAVIPDLPFLRLSKTSWYVLPIQDLIPTPVITTFLMF